MKELLLEIIAEVKRAVRLGSSLFLIVYYENEAHKADFLQLLRKELVNKGLGTRTFDPVHRPEHGTGQLLSQLAISSKENELSLLTGLPRIKDSSRLEESFLGYLNLHRDEIFESGLRLILFLHQANAEQFINSAGDLWDFRHRSYWLERKSTPQSETLWQNLERISSRLELSSEDHSKIEAHLEEVRALVDKTIDKEEKAGLLLDLTRWLLRRYSAPLAIETALEGIAFISNSKTQIRAELEHELAYALKLTSNLPESLEHYQRSLTLKKEIGDREGEAMTLHNIARIYDLWGKYKKALGILEESLVIFREIGDPGGESLAMNSISQVYAALGRYDDAIQVLEKTLKISREIGDLKTEGIVINNISHAYALLHRYEKALKLLEESLLIRRQVGDRKGEVRTLNNMAFIYKAMKNHQEALKLLEESLTISREIGDRQGEGSTLNNISDIYRSLGDYENAQKKLDKSLRIFREIGDTQGEVTAYWNMAVEYERLEDIDKATDFLRKAIEIEESIAHPKLEEHKRHLEELEKRLTRSKTST